MAGKDYLGSNPSSRGVRTKRVLRCEAPFTARYDGALTLVRTTGVYTASCFEARRSDGSVFAFEPSPREGEGAPLARDAESMLERELFKDWH